MFCLTLVECSPLLCLSWTISSTKMHLHMFPLLKMLCKTMKFFHRLKMRKNVVSLMLPNDRRLAVPGSLLFAIPLCLRRNASCTIVHNCALHNPRPVRASCPPPPPALRAKAAESLDLHYTYAPRVICAAFVTLVRQCHRVAPSPHYQRIAPTFEHLSVVHADGQPRIGISQMFKEPGLWQGSVL